MHTFKRIKEVFDNDLSKTYLRLREDGVFDYNNWNWLLPLPETTYWLGNPKLRRISQWINKNIIVKTDINSQITEDVLIRIATGMINNLSTPDYYKRLMHENLIINRKAARMEWNVYALKNSKGLPFQGSMRL